MCGICGIINFDSKKMVSEKLLNSMMNSIRHRGPDDEGNFVDQNIGLGLRRLSVIDIEGGKQPQKNEDGACQIVFNGEIYNYPELRKMCEQKRHRFSTQSDTETILHLYEDLGINCVLPLNGMFAFAIYDRRNRCLTLARDRLGIKPLYYADTGNSLVFASEIKAILCHPEVSQEIDPIALDHYLTYRYVTGARTIFQNIKKLLPGHILTCRNGYIHTQSYWKLSFTPGHNKSEQDTADELTDRLEQSIRRQMVSDVPYGALLSGGIDSSLIVALMSQASNRPVKTFSIGFEENSYNELDHARQISEHFSSDHHELIVRPDPQDLLERTIGYFDEPFGDSSAIPTYLVSQHARNHVTVALSGTGADELFAGYERYWAIPLYRAYRKFPAPLQNFLSKGLNHIPTGHSKKSLTLRARRFVQSANADPLKRHRNITSLFSKLEREALYSSDWKSRIFQCYPDPFTEHFANSNAKSDLHKLLYLDTSTLLADDYLVKDDRMSMAASLELRVPFLDHTLVEFAASLPPHFKLRGFTTKYILKKAARDILPHSIIRRQKHGFEIPIARWIKTELRDSVDDLLFSSRSRSRGLLDTTTVKGILKAHISGQNNFSHQIWALMALEIWFRIYMDTTTSNNFKTPVPLSTTA